MRMLWYAIECGKQILGEIKIQNTKRIRLIKDAYTFLRETEKMKWHGRKKKKAFFSLFPPGARKMNKRDANETKNSPESY